MSRANRLTAGVAEGLRRFRKEEPQVYWLGFLIPKHKRERVYVISAFCHMMLAALGGEREEGCGEGDQIMDLLRARLGGLKDGESPVEAPFGDPEAMLLSAFGTVLSETGVPIGYILQLAEGIRTDAKTKRYATWASLEKSCRRVGGMLGLIVGAVLGLTNSGASEYATKAGVAIQLTLILQNIERDFQTRKIYLPLEDLVRFGYTEKDLGQRLVNERFRDLIRFEISRVRGLLREASEGLKWVAGDRTRLAVSGLLALQSSILRGIEVNEFDVFRKRVRLTMGQRLRLLPQAWRLARE